MAEGVGRVEVYEVVGGRADGFERFGGGDGRGGDDARGRAGAQGAQGREHRRARADAVVYENDRAAGEFERGATAAGRARLLLEVGERGYEELPERVVSRVVNVEGGFDLCVEKGCARDADGAGGPQRALRREQAAEQEQVERQVQNPRRLKRDAGAAARDGDDQRVAAAGVLAERPCERAPGGAGVLETHRAWDLPPRGACAAARRACYLAPAVHTRAVALRPRRDASPEKSLMSTRLPTEEEFRRHLGTKFGVRVQAPRPVELELDEVKGYRAGANEPGGMERFSLFFYGPSDLLVPQGTYALDHPSMGELLLFIVPIGQDNRGFRYEVVLNFRRDEES